MPLTARHRIAVIAVLAALVPATAQAQLGDSRSPAAAQGQPKGALAVVAGNSQHYYRNGYCSASGGVLRPGWAGRFPYWTGQCADNYLGGVNPSGRLVLADALGRRMRVRAWDLTSRKVVASRKVDLEGWTLHAFHVGADGRYYLVVGRENSKERDSFTTLQVRAYSSAWEPVGTAAIRGDAATLGIGVAHELRASTVLADGVLVVHMARFLFGGGSIAHQANLTFAVDTATMRPYRPEETYGDTYVSHSFGQFVDVAGKDAVFVDHGDAYPRALTLVTLRDFFDPAAEVTSDRHTVLRLLPKGKQGLGENYTGTTLNGMVAGPSGALSVGASLPHTHPVAGVGGIKHLHAPNVYLAATDLETGNTRWKWLTRVSPRSLTTVVGEPRIAQVGPDRYAVLFHVESGHRRDTDGEITGRVTLQYRLVDSAGRVLASESWKGRRFIPGSSLFVGGKALWWVAGFERRSADRYRSSDYLFGINVRNPNRPKLLSR